MKRPQRSPLPCRQRYRLVCAGCRADRGRYATVTLTHRAAAAAAFRAIGPHWYCRNCFGPAQGDYVQQRLASSLRAGTALQGGVID